MTKRTPYTPSKKKSSPEREKRIAALKTAIPLLLTLGLLAAVYVFVLIPEEPANVLKRAVMNSTDSNKYTSIRYDGSFGGTNRDISGEFAGQKSNNRDEEFRIRLTKDEIATSVETAHINDEVYVRLSGIENAKTILGAITGAKTPDEATIQLLSEVQNKWIKTSGTTSALLMGYIPCAGTLPGLNESPSIQITDEGYPLIYEAGPILPKDDTEDEIYEARLSTADRVQGSFERQITETVSCLEKSYGKDDFRLREAGPEDVASTKITIRIDPLSSTVKKLTVKQVGMYMVVNLRDYNKDITITTPERVIDASQAYESLSDASKTHMTGVLGLPALQ